MGSGESDVAHIKVAAMIDNKTNSLPTSNFGYYNNEWDKYWGNSTYTWTYPTTIYKYQVRCPKRGCKTFNWLELDKTTPCTECGSKLRAVSDTPDFTIPVK